MSGRALRALLPTLFAASLLATPGIVHATPPGCYRQDAPLTVEEQRLDAPLVPGGTPLAPELVARGGLEPLVREFTKSLCGQQNEMAADRFLAVQGTTLWDTAAGRAQGRIHTGDLDPYDDRPLYWARLELTKAVRQWNPAFQLNDDQRNALIRRLDYSARGITSVSFHPGTRKVLVSGFDPFRLDNGNLNRSNPAGSAALRLDGTTLDTPTGKVEVQAVNFPVQWDEFDKGVVEAAYGPVLGKVDGITTVSQGRPGEFDIERWAGRWRGGKPDNNNAGSTGPVPDARGWPQPANEFIETTLPYQRMIDTASGPFPVRLNRQFCVWRDASQPGVGDPLCRTDQPADGEIAASGGGGDYLSNESMYRSNRLRLGLDLSQLPGGHLHTPVLTNPPGRVTTAQFDADRRTIADQAIALISSAHAPR